MKFADIKNDITFRKIFGNENRKDSLISFLNAVLKFENEQRIQSVRILDPYQLPKLKSGKATIVDVKATDQAGRNFIVEMQVAEKDGFDKRVLYYFSKAYSSQIKRGDQYRKLQPIYFIGILNYEFTKNKDFISRSQITDVETGEQTFKDVEFTLIELPKFRKKRNKPQSLVDKWVHFIKNAENLTVIPDDIDDIGLKSAYEEANQHLWTDLELEAYDKLFMKEEDDRAALDKAKEKGKMEGLLEGKMEGLLEGKMEGLLEGKIEIAQKAIAKGFDNATIADLTGLSMESIENLRNKKTPNKH
jgi:predicted transposase/invertase (TIGR01784 family)